MRRPAVRLAIIALVVAAHLDDVADILINWVPWHGGRVASNGGPAGPGRRVDFFVSHAGQDQAWAEWLAWQVTELGYTVELDVWDWAPGQDFVAWMQAALSRSARLLAVWSPAYFRSVFGTAELRAA